MLDTSLGVIKCESALRQGLEKTNEILEKVSGNSPSFERIRLKNDALVTKAVLLSALARETSVGAHVRSDSRLTSEEKYRIILNNENDEISVKKEALR